MLVVLRIVDGRSESRASETGSGEILLSLEFRDRSSASREGMPCFLMTGEKKVCTSFGDVLLLLLTGVRNAVTVSFYLREVQCG